MFTRTAEYIAHGSRSLNPILHKLRPEQRIRLEKSSKKVGQVLVSRSTQEKRGKKGRKEKAKAKAPAAPVPIVRPRKAVPYSLDLASPVWRSEASPRSPFNYNRPGFLSPLSPLSPFSPIETSDMREERYHGLRRLARVSRAFRDTIVEELPSFAQSAQHVDNVNSYLDLYRIATKSRCMSRDSDVYTACSVVTDPQSAYTACSVKSRRRSSSLSCVQRRSLQSAGSMTPTARTSYIVPHSASVCSTADRPAHYTLMINVPSPRTPNVQVESRSAASGVSWRMSYTLVLNLPSKRSVDLPETPADEDAPLQKQQKEARARAAILTAMQPLATPLDPSLPQSDLSPTTPLPSAWKVRSPRVPYWVRGTYRVSAQGYVRRTHSYSRRSGARVPATPRTIRRERRQGWGGEWKVGKMATVVEGLKEIRTPAPPVPEKEGMVVVPPVPEKEKEQEVVVSPVGEAH
ncbi:hypothetical protein C8T65DRAFT_668931 [Cerioporus squamosus]|nr:hypothetical protein C8T65DRAFT_668931 [Cerioporus squamosus]